MPPESKSPKSEDSEETQIDSKSDKTATTPEADAEVSSSNDKEADKINSNRESISTKKQSSQSQVKKQTNTSATTTNSEPRQTPPGPSSAESSPTSSPSKTTVVISDHGPKSPIIPIALGIILLIVLAGGGYYAYISFFKSEPAPEPISTPKLTASPTPSIQPSPTPEPTSSWQTYSDQNLNFQISYPPSWTVTSSAEYLFGLESTIDSQVPYGPIDPPPTYNYTLTANQIPNPSQLELPDLLTEQYPDEEISISLNKINNLTLYKTSDIPSATGELNYYVELSKDTYLNITLYPYSQDEPYSQQKTAESAFNRILSTLKITQAEPDPQAQDDKSNPTWQTYNNEAMTFEYPLLATVNQQQSIIVTMEGPTQTEDTELIDGLSLNISLPFQIEDQPLNEYVDQRIAQIDQDAEVTPPQPVTIGDFTGYSFTATGSGERTYYLIQTSDGQNTFEIVDSSVDPGNQRYKDIANQIISSIEVTPDN